MSTIQSNGTNISLRSPVIYFFYLLEIHGTFPKKIKVLLFFFFFNIIFSRTFP